MEKATKPPAPEQEAGLEEDFLSVAAKRFFGIEYLFPFQRLVVHNILAASGFYGEERKIEAPRRQLVVVPTGSGKSLCFSLPAVLIEGLTVAVYPLLGLISDQSRRLEAAGIRAGVLRGGQDAGEREALWLSLSDGSCRMILTNPETLLVPTVRERLQSLRVAHWVIDEVHTVCEWGDSFRPAYLRLAEVIRDHSEAQVTGFTATASPRVLGRIEELLFPDEKPQLVLLNPDRPNISYDVLPSLCAERTLLQLLASDPETPGRLERPALVFFSSRSGTEEASRTLRNRLVGADLRFYHAGLAKEEKKEIERWFFQSKDGILCATCAYGMGVDKPDIRTVIHRDPPPTVEAYLQEAGRAGRDGLPSHAVLLSLPRAASRRSAISIMATYADSFRCRRDFLLEALGADKAACGTCDVCQGKRIPLSPEERYLKKFFRIHPGFYSRGDAVSLLCGDSGIEAWERGYPGHPSFGRFRDWDSRDLERAVKTLEETRALRALRRGPLRGKILPWPRCFSARLSCGKRDGAPPR